MPENIKKAFDFVADVTKQMILLSTGLIGFSATFIKELTNGVVLTCSLREILTYSWVCLVLSAACGIGTMLTLSGNLEKRDPPRIYESNTILFSVLQILSFLAGVSLLASFSFQTLPEIIHSN